MGLPLQSLSSIHWLRTGPTLYGGFFPWRAGPVLSKCMLDRDCNGNPISTFPPCYAFRMIFTALAPRPIQSISRNVHKKNGALKGLCHTRGPPVKVGGINKANNTCTASSSFICQVGDFSWVIGLLELLCVFVCKKNIRKKREKNNYNCLDVFF